VPAGHLSCQPKRLGDTCFAQPAFDFTSQLAVGETLSGPVVTATVYSGLDPNPAALVSGAASIINSTQVRQLLTGGVVGVIYELLCQVTTSLGQTLVQPAYQVVIPDLT
jgi:hypothetical protein